MSFTCSCACGDNLPRFLANLIGPADGVFDERLKPSRNLGAEDISAPKRLPPPTGIMPGIKAASKRAAPAHDSPDRNRARDKIVCLFGDRATDRRLSWARAKVASCATYPVAFAIEILL